MKLNRLFALLIALSIGISACSRTYGDSTSTTDERQAPVVTFEGGGWRSYDSLADMVKESELIILAEVTLEGPEYDVPYPEGNISFKYWSYNVVIEQVYAGDFTAGDELTVGMVQGFEGATPFKVGERLVLFLVKEQPGWVAIQSDLGVFVVDGEELRPRSGDLGLSDFQTLSDLVNTLSNLS